MYTKRGEHYCIVHSNRSQTGGIYLSIYNVSIEYQKEECLELKNHDIITFFERC